MMLNPTRAVLALTHFPPIKAFDADETDDV